MSTHPRCKRGLFGGTITIRPLQGEWDVLNQKDPIIDVYGYKSAIGTIDVDDLEKDLKEVYGDITITLTDKEAESYGFYH